MAFLTRENKQIAIDALTKAIDDGVPQVFGRPLARVEYGDPKGGMCSCAVVARAFGWKPIAAGLDVYDFLRHRGFATDAIWQANDADDGGFLAARKAIKRMVAS